MAVIVLSALGVTALAASDYGSAAVSTGTTYTLEEMLVYAIEDERLAEAEYAEIIDTYGITRPFTNIIRAEQSHIAALEPLFENNGLTLPDDTSTDYVTTPASIEDALNAGIQAEINNIDMYDAFLAQDLPEDVEAVFNALNIASQRHLSAFENVLAHPNTDGTFGGIGNAYGANGQKGSAVNRGTGICDGTGIDTMGIAKSQGAGMRGNGGAANRYQSNNELGTGVCLY